MTREEKVFEMAKAIAPTIAKLGLSLQQDLAYKGQNVEECTINGKNIPHAYGETLRIWAEIFVDELEK